VLDTYGSFPQRHRLLIWRALLRLPGNERAAAMLRARGPHPAWARLHARYPGLSPTVARRLGLTLSALAWWCPLLASPSLSQLLPALCFPFVKLCGPNSTCAFEAAATLLMRLLPGLGEAWPRPPRPLLQPALALLHARDVELCEHLRSLGGASCASACLWALLSTAFSDALRRSAWLQATDHLLASARGGPFGPALAAAVLMRLRPALLACGSRAELARALCTPQPLPMDSVLREVYDLCAALPPPPARDSGLACLGSPRALAYPPLPLGARAAAEAERCQCLAAQLVMTERPLPRAPAPEARRRSSGGSGGARDRAVEARRAEAEAEACEASRAALRRRAMRDESLAAEEAEARALQARVDAAQRAWEEAARRAEAADEEVAALREQAARRRAGPAQG